MTPYTTRPVIANGSSAYQAWVQNVSETTSRRASTAGRQSGQSARIDEYALATLLVLQSIFPQARFDPS
jgi:hypothetical protein